MGPEEPLEAGALVVDWIQGIVLVCQSFRLRCRMRFRCQRQPFDEQSMGTFSIMQDSGTGLDVLLQSGKYRLLRRLSPSQWDAHGVDLVTGHREAVLVPGKPPVEVPVPLP